MAEITIGATFLWGMLIFAGIVIGAVAVVWASWSKRKGHKLGAGITLIVAVMFVGLGIWGLVATPVQTGSVTPQCGPGTGYLCIGQATAVATSGAAAGYNATWYSSLPPNGLSANTWFFGAVYNRTTSEFITASKNSTFPPTGHTYITIPIILTRTDIQTQAGQFTVTISAIPTVYSTGASPIQVSPMVGYSNGGGTQSQWMLKFANGTQSGVVPTVVAPGTSTNIETNTVTVASGSSATTTLTQYLGGAAISGYTAQSFPYSAFLSSIGPTGTAQFSETITLGGGATFANGGTTLNVVMFVYGSQK